MNKLYQTICLAGLIVLSSFAGATKLVVNQGTENCEFELASGDAVSINPTTGDVSAIVTNLEECKGAPLEPPTITSFTATSSVAPGGTIQLSWNTQDASDCQAITTGVTNPLPGWSGSKAVPSGSQSITAPSPNDSTTYRARLECSNSAGADQETRTVTVSTGNGGECAADRPPPQNLAPATHAIWADSGVDGRFFEEVYIQEFPGSNNSREYYQKPGYYHAMKFNTGALPTGATGSISADEMNGSGGFASNVMLGRRFISISKCPGDFHKDELSQGCYKLDDNGSHNFRWAESSHPWVASGGACGLEPFTDYYLNIVYTGSPEGDPNPTWACIGAGSKNNCGALSGASSSHQW